MNVKIKKLSSDAIIPEYKTGGAAGFDLYASEECVLLAGVTALISTGIAMSIPEGYEMQIRPRSGVTLKTPLRIPNSPATIDSDYRGEVKVMIENAIDTANFTKNEGFYIDGERIFFSENTEFDMTGACLIRKGDRVAQGILAPVGHADFEVVDELTDTARGAGGFGHSGVK